MRSGPPSGALKLAAFGAATALLLYASLAPVGALPSVDVWDKAQHALAWGGLTALGVAFWPARWRAVAVFAVLLSAGVEVLQAAMPLGRQGDWRDLVANAVGVLLALRLVQAWRWARRRA